MTLPPRPALPAVTRVRVPPVKSQGIKTRIVPLIMASIRWDGQGRWIEPFLGSGVVAFNVLPQRALLGDTNVHVVALYQAIQAGRIGARTVAAHLAQEGAKLLAGGEDHYYAVRDRFNAGGNPLDFLFLNRACFNGLMRFNRRGGFNVPFCRKPERFRAALVTKVANQVAWVEQVLAGRDWVFQVADWADTLGAAGAGDFVYADPPYAGRHTDYFNRWSDGEADRLAAALRGLPAGFACSMWLENRYRRNDAVARWFAGYPVFTWEHFYHLGATETLRNAMREALVVSPGYAVAGGVPCGAAPLPVVGAEVGWTAPLE
ncbi:MAG: Dam family site-specific DNA-(adenine-N6)-methyltransferase [Acetobacteraceae bacterium]|nr:Dam family site-specific DNA-(adenine-N6)-methyltransferase [Acetobacteraceae bacterium]